MRKDEPMSARTDYLRKLGYEQSDVSLPTLMKWLLALVIFAGGTAFATWIIYKVFVPEIGVEQHSFQQAAEIKPPPEPNPLIQANPHRDIRQFREEEEARLNSYGWVDQKAGTVRIPVARAMDLVLQRGLPARVPGGPANMPSGPNATNTIQPAPTTGGAADSEGHSTESPGAPPLR